MKMQIESLNTVVKYGQYWYYRTANSDGSDPDWYDFDIIDGSIYDEFSDENMTSEILEAEYQNLIKGKEKWK